MNNCSSLEFIGDSAFERCTVRAISLPESGVRSTGKGAFQYCRRLGSFTIPDVVETVSDNTFLNCEERGHIYFPDSLKSIGKYAFDGCRNLTEVELPDGVTSSLGERAFGYCRNLKSISVPASVNYIGENAFMDCMSLTIRCSKGSYAESYAVKNKIDHKTK